MNERNLLDWDDMRSPWNRVTGTIAALLSALTALVMIWHGVELLGSSPACGLLLLLNAVVYILFALDIRKDLKE